MTSVRAGTSAATATKKATATTDAPIWKNYLTIRSSLGTRGPGGSASTGSMRSRKRTKPSTGPFSSSSSSAPSTAVPPSHKPHNSESLDSSVASRVRTYWEQLSATERQQILFIDDPDLVKQLYKLNLSLLCVGLMQRHLKTPLRTAAAAAAPFTTKGTGAQTTAAAAAPAPTAASGSSSASSASDVVVAKPPAAAAAASVATAAAAEKTYELLEAMEFMDIGTGILTVKSELVEVPERLFALVRDVLSGFGSSLHVLTDAQFTQLFVVESEVVTTWEDYERLIAMLVEQLMLKSYVAHLEREAARQMAELLLEVSLEDVRATTSRASAKKKKSAKTAKTTKARAKRETAAAGELGGGTNATMVEQPEPEDFDAVARVLDDSIGSNSRRSTDSDSVERHDANAIGSIDDRSREDGSDTVVVLAAASVEDVARHPPMPHRLGHVASPEKPTALASVDLAASDTSIHDPRTRVPASSLNPHASVFEPQTDSSLPLVSPRHVIRKRKLDSLIVALDDDDVGWDNDDTDLAYDSDALLNGSDDDDDDDGLDLDIPRRHKTTRWRTSDDMTALAWQLEQIYASTATMLGWDSSRQCDVDDMALGMPWDNADALWRTAPTEVVRYFSPGRHDRPHAVGPFFHPPLPPPPPSHLVTTGHAFHSFTGATGSGHAQPPSPKSSRYYFAPPGTTPSAVSSGMPPTYLAPPSGPATGTATGTRSGGTASTQPLIKSYYHSR